MEKLGRVISNETECTDLEAPKATQIVVPEGLTWGEFSDKIVPCVLTPGHIYAKHSAVRAEAAGIRLGPFFNGDWHMRPRDRVPTVALSSFNGALISIPFAFGGSFQVVPLIVGIVAGPWVFLNLFPALNGVYLDAKILFKKANISTVANGARERIQRFRETPMRQTFRLNRKESGPRNGR